jgi:hypothetical protein
MRSRIWNSSPLPQNIGSANEVVGLGDGASALSAVRIELSVELFAIQARHAQPLAPGLLVDEVKQMR